MFLWLLDRDKRKTPASFIRLHNEFFWHIFLQKSLTECENKIFNQRNLFFGHMRHSILQVDKIYKTTFLWWMFFKIFLKTIFYESFLKRNWIQLTLFMKNTFYHSQDRIKIWYKTGFDPVKILVSTGILVFKAIITQKKTKPP